MMELLLMLVGGFILVIFIIIVLYNNFTFKREKEIYNEGIAPSGDYWEIYNIDSKGYRYYKDHNKSHNNLCRITCPEIDAEITGYVKE